MNWLTGVFVYLLIWWIVLFAILPWKNDLPSDAEPGMMFGAPANPRIKKKFVITTIIAAALWLGLLALVHYDILSFQSVVEDPPD
jgi:predicted secreted protein